MKNKRDKDMIAACETPDELKEDQRELPDTELEDIVGGADILERVKPPSNDRPPIEAPILNPFG